jgi:hypothetical protein
MLPQQGRPAVPEAARVGLQFVLSVCFLWARAPAPLSLFSANLPGRVLGPDGHLVPPLPGRSGYDEMICLLDGSPAGRRRLVRVDHLVLAAWTLDGDRPDRGVVHVDGDPSNNCAPNLRWATASEQALNRFQTAAGTWEGLRVRRIPTLP